MEIESKISETIFKNAKEYRLDPKLIAAIIIQESGGNIFACRYEDGFFRKYLESKTRATLKGRVPLHFKTEIYSRAFSYGLMQIMGNTAREAGYDNQFLTGLVEPEANIDLGCKILSRFISTQPSIEAALLRWNGGSNKNYPNEVLKHMDGADIDSLLDGSR